MTGEGGTGGRKQPYRDTPPRIKSASRCGSCSSRQGILCLDDGRNSLLFPRQMVRRMVKRGCAACGRVRNRRGHDCDRQQNRKRKTQKMKGGVRFEKASGESA